MQPCNIKEPYISGYNLSLDSHTHPPSVLATKLTKLDRIITMPQFRVDGVFLFVPTGETERCREYFNTFEEAISVSCDFIRDLQNDAEIPTLQINSWTDLTGQRDEDGVEEIFGCHFRVGDEGVVQGMILVSAFHEQGDGDG